jgi:hypothetical protein
LSYGATLTLFLIIFHNMYLLIINYENSIYTQD